MTKEQVETIGELRARLAEQRSFAKLEGALPAELRWREAQLQALDALLAELRQAKATAVRIATWYGARLPEPEHALIAQWRAAELAGEENG